MVNGEKHKGSFEKYQSPWQRSSKLCDKLDQVMFHFRQVLKGRQKQSLHRFLVREALKQVLVKQRDKSKNPRRPATWPFPWKGTPLPNSNISLSLLSIFSHQQLLTLKVSSSVYPDFIFLTINLISFLLNFHLFNTFHVLFVFKVFID